MLFPPNFKGGMCFFPSDLGLSVISLNFKGDERNYPLFIYRIL